MKFQYEHQGLISEIDSKIFIDEIEGESFVDAQHNALKMFPQDIFISLKLIKD